MAAMSKLELLPTEIIYLILSHLIHPRSSLPGLNERQSDHDCPQQENQAAKQAYHLNNVVPPDIDRFAANLFRWTGYYHPFLETSLTSRRLLDCTEGFCAHLIKDSNKFNLPLSEAETNGPEAMYPDLSGIVYRRLWLQYAPRHCVYCNAVESTYPHVDKRTLKCCMNCFYAQVYTIGEVEEQFHLSRLDLVEHRVSGNKLWVLRVEIEALVLKLYGSKKFHGIQRLNEKKQLCQICVEAGTLHRIMALRDQLAQRRPQLLEPESNSDGWLLRERAGATPSLTNKWGRYLYYHQNLWLYDDDESGCIYHLGPYDDIPSVPLLEDSD